METMRYVTECSKLSSFAKRQRLEHSISEQFLEIEKDQCDQLLTMEFGDPVCYVYNPLQYAEETHQLYVNKYCNNTKRFLFLGMNPGPFGMAQNGVPFGEVSLVKNWLKIDGKVGKPVHEHPQRLIQGFDCKRSEVSGKRFWELFKDISGTPDTFFNFCFVHNYCPFAFLSQNGKNITPPQLKVHTRNVLNQICDESLYKVVNLLKVQVIIGVGKYAEKRARIALSDLTGISIYGMMHPSPVNPAANKGWKNLALQCLEKFDILNYVSVKNNLCNM